MRLKEQVGIVVREMVRQSRDGVFYGSPRSIMERVGVSSGEMYKELRRLGFIRSGRAKKGIWPVPVKYLELYKDPNSPM